MNQFFEGFSGPSRPCNCNHRTHHGRTPAREFYNLGII